MEPILIIGAGGHARTIVDTIEKCGKYRIAGFIDKEGSNEVYRTYQVIGKDDCLPAFYEKGIRKAAIGIGTLGNSSIRCRIFEYLKKIGYQLPVIIDPSAVIAADAVIGEGTYIGRNAVINANAQIRNMCILNTASVIEHDCIIGSYSHVSVGAVICGETIIGENSFIGANATVIQGCSIGRECIVGAGSVVINDLPDRCTVVGVPAKAIKKKGDIIEQSIDNSGGRGQS